MAVILVTVGMTVSVMIQTIGDLKLYPGIDLRAKVVGARLLVRGMDPYYDFHRVTLPDHLRMLNEDTYSPPLLLLYAPLCELPWWTQRVIYFCVDWIAILLCFGIQRQVFPKNASATALWVAFVFIFIAAPGFRLHLERGQYYIELALLAALASIFLLRKSESWFHTLPLAILVLLRPTFAICIVGLMILRRVRYAVLVACLCVLFIAAMVPLAGVDDWKGYFAEIRANQRELVDVAYRPAIQKTSATTSQVFEGIDFSKSLDYPGSLADRTLLGLARSSVSPVLARFVHRIAPSERRFEQLNFVGLLLAAFFDLGLMYGFSRKRIGGLTPIAFLFLAPLNLELFAPQHFAYCDVLLLVPLMLILAAAIGRASHSSWWLYGAILAAAFALPWLSVHFDKHVPLASFFGYVGTLTVLNLVSVIEFLKSWHRPSASAPTGVNEFGDRSVTYLHT